MYHFIRTEDGGTEAQFEGPIPRVGEKVHLDVHGEGFSTFIVYDVHWFVVGCETNARVLIKPHQPEDASNEQIPKA